MLIVIHVRRFLVPVLVSSWCCAEDILSSLRDVRGPQYHIDEIEK